ncbi:hypothetical protein O3G_MSEX009475 [Manduca sexta]|uniref:Uncharacterized protein n=1 Tax=Manduca sexta TaxID=7130 RepID=A0A921ZEH5_MANSE|nr:hypothetical protein O3G_MSEX009475 [Manduca sexta]KAG6455922.1 hypothetical protein O3G_MSEX009475 [Manduca sexta]
MSKCLCSRCFFCIGLRAGCAIIGTILVIFKMVECFCSTIVAIDLYTAAMKDKSRHNIEGGGERLGAFAVAAFHWITMLVVCALLEGLRKRDPKRVFGFNICSIVAYALYIPIFIFVVAKNGGDYTQHDWVITGLRVGVIAWYAYTILIARSYHHELTNKGSNRNPHV